MSPRKSQSLVAGIALLMTFVGVPILAFAQSTGKLADNSVSTQRDPLGGTNEVYKIGNGVSAPKLIHVVDPKLPKAVKKNRIHPTAEPCRTPKQIESPEQSSGSDGHRS